ncbi:MAG: 2,3-bisphosphoglycerate-independent phosphoglycerate mutase [Gammaproteobacteria bacterium]|nr:2,3-bisphosphoglycerate-independent phosphoglycerate mutase [Gammaproteobacteria bacterium]
MPAPPKPLVLIVMDGWGYSENSRYNAIAAARKPTWDYFWSHYPHTLIQASESAVGLPSHQMGNSEVGHLNLGAGRVVYQEYTRINRAIVTGSFFTNKTLTDAVDLAIETHKAVHILGLLSPGGVHSHEDQIQAMAELAVKRGAQRVYLHAFLDGRDTPPSSAHHSIQAMEAKFTALGCGRIADGTEARAAGQGRPACGFASVIGRYYAMDRDHRWPRIQAAYDLVTQAKAEFSAPSASAALAAAYARGETDEFVKATVIAPAGEAPVRIEDGDVLIFMNFRSDRARQITRPFIEDNFDGFTRAVRPRLGRFVSLTEYQSEFHIPVAFPPDRLRNVLGACLAGLGKHQLRIAETEKYAHVTFFFNGGLETPFEFEDRILVPSPTDVPTYNLKPEMSAPRVTDEVVKAVTDGVYDVIICNFANPDMVGHTGDFNATVKAIETIDGCLQRIHDAVRAVGGEILITADHGNAEQMYDPETGQAHTAHTTNPVPFVYIGRKAHVAPSGSLEDVAPTMLYLMNVPIPSEMSGRPLVEID